jgi:hypothetical protein
MAIAWHRIFGMALTRYFAGSGWKVEVEVDLSRQQQRLDIVILRRVGTSAPVAWPDGCSILNDLLEHYGLEGIPMPYTMQDFEREVEEKILRKLTPEQLLARLTPEQLLARLTPEQRVEGLTPEQLLARLTLEQRLAGISPEQFLQHLSREEIEKYLQKVKSAPAQDKPPSEPSEPRP